MKLAWITLGSISLALCVYGGELKTPPIDARAQRASSQKSAIKLARSIDLPALRFADRLVITVAGKPGDEPTKSVEISHKRLLNRTRSLLTVKESRPSAGMASVHLTWFTDDKPVRRIWLMES